METSDEVCIPSLDEDEPSFDSKVELMVPTNEIIIHVQDHDVECDETMVYETMNISDTVDDSNLYQPQELPRHDDVPADANIVNCVVDSSDNYSQCQSVNNDALRIGGEHFMLNCVAEFKELLEEYYERTSTRFVGWRKTKYFGLPSSECSLAGHQVQWYDSSRNTNNGLDNLVQFDGIPYMIVGHYDMDCQFGNDRNASHKAKRKQKKAAGIINTRTHHFNQPTKRCGCPAKISAKQIIRFPEFKIDKGSKWKRNDRSTKLKAKLKECRESVKMEAFIVGRLPHISEHKHHESIKGTENVLQELIVLAQELYLEDKTYSQIQQSLRDYVIEDLFWNKEPPDISRRKFYPTLRDIRYFCTRALQLLHFTDDEQEYIRKTISDIELQGNINVSFTLTDQKTSTNDDLLEQTGNVGFVKNTNKKDEEKKIQTFLFCNQSDSQHRLLKRYSNVAYLIEIENNLPSKNALTYKMYTILVQTNVDYQVAGCITVSKQKKDGLIDGLRLFREWNPSWNPKYFIVDCTQMIYDAISIVFPESQYFLNPQSCERKWYKYFNKQANNLQHHAEEVMNYLKTMQCSLTEHSLSVAAQLLEASDIWQKSDNLREWFQNNWLPLAKQWVFGYRPEDLMILQHLKSSIDDSINLYKSALQQSSKFKGFLEMIESISSNIPSAEYEKYIERNKKAYLFYMHYSKTTKLPEYVKNVPIPLLPYIDSACKLAESTNFVITQDNSDAFNVQYNVVDGDLNNCEKAEKEMKIVETEFGSIEYFSKVVPGENTISFGDSYSQPFCTCSHWLFYRLPCVHIMSVFLKVPGWKYDMLSPLYRASPLIEIDCSCINFPIKDLHLSYTFEKECQTDGDVTMTTELDKDLIDNVFEIPSTIWDYFIILSQTKDFLKHLDKMAFLFKNKNVHRKFRQQLEKTILILETDSLKNKGQKIEFTTKNAIPQKQTNEDCRMPNKSSLKVENTYKKRNELSNETQNVTPVEETKGVMVKQMVTGLYKVSDKDMSCKINSSEKSFVRKLPFSSDHYWTTSCHQDINLSKASVTEVVSSALLNSIVDSPSDSTCHITSLPSNNKQSNNRKRKLVDFNVEQLTNISKSTIKPVELRVQQVSANKDILLPNDTKKDKELLSVLNYLPILNPTTPKQVMMATVNKCTSNVSFMKHLPPNVGITRTSFAKIVMPAVCTYENNSTKSVLQLSKTPLVKSTVEMIKNKHLPCEKEGKPD